MVIEFNYFTKVIKRTLKKKEKRKSLALLLVIVIGLIITKKRYYTVPTDSNERWALPRNVNYNFSNRHFIKMLVSGHVKRHVLSFFCQNFITQPAEPAG